MSKWMGIVVHPGDEENTYLDAFLFGLQERLDKQKVQLKTPDRPYLLYVVVSDHENEQKDFVSIQSQLNYIYQKSQKYNFNYNILYRGRQYWNKLDQVSNLELVTRITREINFVKPQIIFMPDKDSYVDNLDIFNLNNVLAYLYSSYFRKTIQIFPYVKSFVDGYAKLWCKTYNHDWFDFTGLELQEKDIDLKEIL